MKEINLTALLKAVMETKTDNKDAFVEFADRNVGSIISMMTDIGEKPTKQKIVDYLKQPGKLLSSWKEKNIDGELDPWIVKQTTFETESLSAFIDQLSPLIDQSINRQLSGKT